MRHFVKKNRYYDWWNCVRRILVEENFQKESIKKKMIMMSALLIVVKSIQNKINEKNINKNRR